MACGHRLKLSSIRRIASEEDRCERGPWTPTTFVWQKTSTRRSCTARPRSTPSSHRPRRQVHRHRHQGLRQDAVAEGQARPLPAGRPGDLPADRQPARQADRRQDLRARVDRPVLGIAVAVVEGLALGDRAGGAEARRQRRGPRGRTTPGRPRRRPPAAQRHRSLRAPPRLHAERAAALRDRHRRPPGAAAACPQDTVGPLHRRHRRVLQQARRGRAVEPERHRRALAQRLVLLAARPGRGGVSAAPHQPSPEDLRRDQEGSLRPAATAHGDGPAVPRQRRRHRLLARGAARDIRQQRAPGAHRAHGPARPGQGQAPRGISRPHQHRRHLHPRGGRRVRVRLPTHAAAAARPDDDRRAPHRPCDPTSAATNIG